MNVPFAARTSTLVAAILAATTAFADTWHVPDDFLTIQAAIDAAVDGDEVVVADGTYTGDGNRDMDFGGKAITVRSANGATACVIDIQASDVDPHRAFHFHSGETAASVVEGFTIQNGFISQEAAEDGGGAVYMLGSSPTFVDCEFLQNHVEANFLYGGGGAVRCQSDSSPTFIGCTFNGNTAFGRPQQPVAGAVAI